MRVNGKIMSQMDQAKLHTLMDPDMWGNSSTTRKTEKGHFIKEGMSIEGISKTIILMVNFGMKDKMDKFMMENGKVVRSMEVEHIIGQMEAIIQGNMLMAKNKERESWCIQMDRFMMVNGLMGKSMGGDKFDLRREILSDCGNVAIWQLLLLNDFLFLLIFWYLWCIQSSFPQFSMRACWWK